MQTVIQLKGMDELKRALAELEPEIATKAGTAATRKSAQFMRDRMRDAAPQGHEPTVKSRKRKDGTVVKVDYGHLRPNMRIRRVKARRQHFIVYHVTVGRAFWGRFLEYGTINMEARPWMRPTFDASAKEVVVVQLTELDAAIKRANRKLARLARKG